MQFLDDVGSGLRAHLVEYIASIDEIEILEEVGGTLLVKSFEDVRGLVGMRPSDLFPGVLVGIEILLGLNWPAACEFPKGCRHLAGTWQSELHCVFQPIGVVRRGRATDPEWDGVRNRDSVGFPRGDRKSDRAAFAAR
jgi:hypothetical protein